MGCTCTIARRVAYIHKVEVIKKTACKAEVFLCCGVNRSTSGHAPVGSFSISSCRAPFCVCVPCSMPINRITHGRQKHKTGTRSMSRMHGRQMWMYVMMMYTRHSCRSMNVLLPTIEKHMPRPNGWGSQGAGRGKNEKGKRGQVIEGSKSGGRLATLLPRAHDWVSDGTLLLLWISDVPGAQNAGRCTTVSCDCE